MFSRTKKLMTLGYEHYKESQEIFEQFEMSIMTIERLLERACENFKETKEYIDSIYAKKRKKLK